MDAILKKIPVGEKNAIHQKDLAKECQLSSRQVKKFINALRNQNIIICSGPNGYWFPENTEEKIAFVKSMKKQALTRLNTIKGTINALNDIEGQIDFLSYSETAIKDKPDE